MTFPVRTAMILARWFGCGLAPKAPGTVGTLGALPLAYIIADQPMGFKLGVWIALALIGIWSSAIVCRETQQTDNQTIVIDEVVGLGLTVLPLSTNHTALTWGVAFLIFRILDVTKPYPIRKFDLWSKKQSDNPGYAGMGVMLDDVLAGLYGWLFIAVLLELGALH